MMHLRRRLVIPVLAAVALGACVRTAPLQDGGGDFIGRGTLNQRADQVRRAGAELGWVIESRSPGLMRGTLNLRSHQAVVDIPYDTGRFAIRYAASTNLDYNGTLIHRNYNSWVQNLQAAIIAQSDADARAAAASPARR